MLDRAEQLFGEDGAEVVADRLEKHRTGPIQATLFPLDDDPTPTPIKGRRRKGLSMSPTNRCASIAARRRSTTFTQPC